MELPRHARARFHGRDPGTAPGQQPAGDPGARADVDDARPAQRPAGDLLDRVLAS
ncbi:hypothetical protein [Streptomyces sp. SID5473]|uniref:hypothetical protein n=1 Tax=Streptomyces sp. SID5473 TaxID=2690299 RepID=UPI001F3CCB2F|nr:hypothetical protein [Streptomyces sp. SID5473]